MKDVANAWLPEPPEPRRKPSLPAIRRRLPYPIPHLLLILLVTVRGQAVAAGAIDAGDAVVHANVVAASERQPVLIINRGADHGISVGDHAACIEGGRVLAAGDVIHVEAAVCGIDLTSSILPGSIPPGELIGKAVAVAPSRAASDVRRELRRETYAVAQVDSVLPGGQRVWIDAGSSTGWRVGDCVLLSRGTNVVGWGQIVRIAARYGLVALAERRGPLPALGDRVETYGKSTDHDPIRSRVVAVESAGNETTIVVAGSANAGIDVGNRLDLFREERYVGFARVIATAPVIRAESVTAFERVSPTAGDEAIVRPQALTAKPRAGYVFRLEPDYGLVNLGSADGIVKGQTLVTHDAAGTIVRLSVRALYEDHCGATVVDIAEDEGGRLPLWAQVTTIPPSEGNHGDRLCRPTQQENLPEAPWLFAVVLPHGVMSAIGDYVVLDGGRVGVIVGREQQRGIVVRVDGLRH